MNSELRILGEGAGNCTYTHASLLGPPHDEGFDRQLLSRPTS